MPQIVVTIDGKTYRMACAEGEEDHLTGLAAEVDRRIAELRKSFGEIGDQRLTVMAAIMATDELSESRRRVAQLERELASAEQSSRQTAQRSATSEAQLASYLDQAAQSIERITAKLSRS